MFWIGIEGLGFGFRVWGLGVGVQGLRSHDDVSAVCSGNDAHARGAASGKGVRLLWVGCGVVVGW